MHKITADMKVCDILEIDQKFEQTLISHGLRNIRLFLFKIGGEIK